MLACVGFVLTAHQTAFATNEKSYKDVTLLQKDSLYKNVYKDTCTKGCN